MGPGRQWPLCLEQWGGFDTEEAGASTLRPGAGGSIWCLHRCLHLPVQCVPFQCPLPVKPQALTVHVSSDFNGPQGPTACCDHPRPDSGHRPLPGDTYPADCASIPHSSRTTWAFLNALSDLNALPPVLLPSLLSSSALGFSPARCYSALPPRMKLKPNILNKCKLEVPCLCLEM